MKTLKVLLIPALLLSSVAFRPAGKKFQCTNGKVTFYSKTPIEDIDATSQKLTGVINPENKKVVFIVKIKSFQFKKSLMQEHFNENYMESDKYPNATFDGKINEDIDLNKPGIYDVTASGPFTVHGVTQQRTIPGKLIVQKDKIVLSSSFKVKVADHKIEIPSVVGNNIAEVIDVAVNADMKK